MKKYVSSLTVYAQKGCFFAAGACCRVILRIGWEVNPFLWECELAIFGEK